MKPEKDVQKEIMDYIKFHGGYCVKVIRANDTGVHDILACINGFFVSIEVKAEKYADDPLKAASARQKKHIEMVRDAKGVSMCVATLEQFKKGLGTLSF